MLSRTIACIRRPSDLRPLGRFTQVTRGCLSRGGSRRFVHCLKYTRNNEKISTAKFSTLIDEQKIIKSPLRDVEIPDSPFLPHFIMENWGEFKHQSALINGETGEKMTYAELKDKIIKVGSALHRMGYGRGDIATLMCPNCPEFCVFYMGAISIGMTVSSVNSLYTPYELAGALNNAGSKILAVHSDLLGVAKDALKSCSTVQKTISFGDGKGVQTFANLLEDDGKAFLENVDFDSKGDVVALPYSSGTTGLPKGVMLTSYSMAANMNQLGSPEFINPLTGDTYLCVLPLYHGFAQNVVFFFGLRYGATIVTMAQFDPVVYLENIQKYRPSVLHTVPPIMLFLGSHPLVAQYDLSSVRLVFYAAAPMPAQMLPKIQERFGPNTSLTQGYGMTEASPAITVNPSYNVKSATVGIPIHNTSIKIKNIETDELLGLNQEGEICFQGPQMMKGYFKNEAATTDVIIDGWFHTGDIGYVDDDGFLLITDRLKELIKYKAYQVAPAEMEDLLLTHPAVVDAAVIGKPDDVAGELPRAYVVLKQGEQASEEDIYNFVKEKAAPHKHLRGGVEFRTEIPKSAAGKILRRVLRDELLNNK